MSTESIKSRINMNGLYRYKPEYRPEYNSYYKYYCTFKPYNIDGKLYMLDTYCGDGSLFTIELSKRNVNDFVLIFDFDDVEIIDFYGVDFLRVADQLKNIYKEWVDWFMIPMDSGEELRIFIKKDSGMIEYIRKENVVCYAVKFKDGTYKSQFKKSGEYGRVKSIKNAKLYSSKDAAIKNTKDCTDYSVVTVNIEVSI